MRASQNALIWRASCAERSGFGEGRGGLWCTRLDPLLNLALAVGNVFKNNLESANEALNLRPRLRDAASDAVCEGMVEAGGCIEAAGAERDTEQRAERRRFHSFPTWLPMSACVGR